MTVGIYTEEEIRRAVTMDQAIDCVERALAAYSSGLADVPPVVHLEVPENRGEVHIKAARIRNEPVYVVKVASGFYGNGTRNLPVGSGMMMAFSAETGFPLAVLLDNGYLTELRTAAAGAVAARHLAVAGEVEQVAVIGAGVQGRFQLEALRRVRPFRRALVYDHHTTNVVTYLREMRGRLGGDAEIERADTLHQAVRGSAVVITTTPARSPYLRPEWVGEGTHITAMGSDGPGKQELFPEVLALADRVFADSLQQCLAYGEIHSAIASGHLRKEDVAGELGEVILGRVPGRQDDRQITVCDLTGVGVQDAAIAQLALSVLQA